MKKSYEAKRAKRRAQGKGRNWRLERLNMEAVGVEEKKKGGGRKADDRENADLEQFLQVLDRCLCCAGSVSEQRHISLQAAVPAVGCFRCSGLFNLRFADRGLCMSESIARAG